jgi:uncharacterized SAM-binding protein YcdF (DUF218 family)
MNSGRPSFNPLSIGGLAMGALAGLIIESLRLTSLISFWHDSAWFVGSGALTGALLWKTRLRWVVASGTASLLALWALVAFTPLAAAVASGLPRRDPPRSADAVFVLASSIQRDGGLTSASISRVVHGVELVAEGRAPVLLLSDLDQPYPSYLPVAKQLLEHLKIDCEITAVGPSTNTHEEALALARLYRQRGWRRVIVVTSPYHSRRACAAVEHEGVEVVCSPSAETEFDADNLERPADRRLAFSSATHERIGLWLYRQRGWLGAAKLGD